MAPQGIRHRALAACLPAAALGIAPAPAGAAGWTPQQPFGSSFQFQFSGVMAADGTVLTADQFGGRTVATLTVADPRPDGERAFVFSATADLKAPVLSNVRLSAKRVRRGRTASLRFALERRVGKARTITSRVAAGARRLRISTRRLRPGTYRLTLVATGAAGNASRPVTRTLTVTKAKKKRRK